MECCFTDLFTGIPLTIHEQASIMAAQPSPFPSLMIHQATNTMVVPPWNHNVLSTTGSIEYPPPSNRSNHPFVGKAGQPVTLLVCLLLEAMDNVRN